MLGFEELEAARYANYLAPGGVAIVADFSLVPVTVFESKIPYPDWSKSSEILRQFTKRVHHVPVSRISRELDNPRALNILMLGYLAFFLDMSKTKWQDNISRKLPSRFVKEGLAAFERGKAEAGKSEIAREGR